MIVVQFSVMILLPVILSVLIRLYEKKKPEFFKSERRIVIIGILFGLVCIYGTECGVNTGIAIYNTRDAAVLCAGLFSWKSAFIACAIGSIERFLAPLWGVGAYTRLACSIATLFAGFFATFLDRIFFKRRPSVFEGFVCSAFIEVFHLFMVFITHKSGMHTAASIIQTMTVPMVLLNSASVVLSILSIDLIDKVKIEAPDKKSLAVQFNLGLFITMVIAFTLSIGFTRDIQKTITKTDTEQLLKSNIDDVKYEITSKTTTYDLLKEISNSTQYKHIDSTGYIIIADSEGTIISDIYENNFYGKNLVSAGFPKDMPESETLQIGFIKNIESYYMNARYYGFTIIAVIPVEEAKFAEYMAVSLSVFIEFLVIAVLFILVTMLIRKLVITNIDKVNRELYKITKGDLKVKLNIETNNEFKSLSKGINNTVNKLKKLINEANRRIDAELSFAKQIQEGSLPSVFPPYPERNDFDIFASMDAAKEIGGDFYDFFFTSQNRFYFLIADVSGKGIPASLFMMRAKTLIRDLAETGIPLSELAKKANNTLCQNNDAGLFVTAWIGCLDLSSGKLKYVNAGHNPPIFIKNNEKPEFIKNISGLVLAGMENVPYKEYETILNPGDKLFLYTDGVTEATNTKLKLYGENRLEKILIKNSSTTDPAELCKSVIKDIDSFAGKAQQFDDITVLGLIYKGQRG